MPIDQRELLTVEKIKSDMRKSVNFSNLAVSVICFIFSVFISCPVLIMFILDADRSSASRFDFVMNIILVSLFCIIPIIIAIVGFSGAISVRRFIKSENFRVVEAELLSVAEGEFTTSNTTERENALYFNNYGRVVVNSRVCSYSIPGDVFYLVIDNRNGDVILIYNSKLYKYRP